MITLIYHCYKLERASEFPTLAAAIDRALELYNGEAGWPVEIRRGDKVLWEQSGPLETGDSLREFAREHALSGAGGRTDHAVGDSHQNETGR